MAISSKESEQLAIEGFWLEARYQRCCAVTGSTKEFEAHHVVEKRWLKANGFPLWDRRNALRLHPDVHGAHTSRMKKIPMSALREENIDYAFEIMGDRAMNYLPENYEGSHPHFEALASERERQQHSG